MSYRGVWRCLVVALIAGWAVLPVEAQTSAENEAYVVAYVDVRPSERPAMLAALSRYREATRRASRESRIDAFEQVGRPAHFAVVEAWKDRAALEAHQMTPHARAFREALQSIRVSGYDERPYKPLATASSLESRGGSPVYVVSHVDIGGGGGQADAPGLLRQLAEVSRMEPGCLRFDVLQHALRGNHFTVVEAWEDQRALDAHVAAPHTRAYRDAVQPISGSPLDERVYSAIGTQALP